MAKSRAEIKPKSKQGGRRKGAGRKPNAVKALATEIVAAEKDVLARVEAAVAAFSPEATALLMGLARGGHIRGERRLAPAGTVTAKLPVFRPVLDRKTGEPLLDENGRVAMEVQVDAFHRPVLIEQLVFPDLPREQMVEVARSESLAEPDRAALIYLLDRVLGRPKQAVEHSGKDGGAIPITIYLPANGRDQPRAEEPPAQLPAPGAVLIDVG